MRPPILGIFSRNGGTGKTTIIYHLAGSLEELGLRVLMIDQGNNRDLASLIDESDLYPTKKNDDTFEYLNENLVLARSAPTEPLEFLGFLDKTRSMNLDIAIMDCGSYDALDNCDYFMICTVPDLFSWAALKNFKKSLHIYYDGAIRPVDLPKMPTFIGILENKYNDQYVAYTHWSEKIRAEIKEKGALAKFKRAKILLKDSLFPSIMCPFPYHLGTIPVCENFPLGEPLAGIEQDSFQNLACAVAYICVPKFRKSISGPIRLEGECLGRWRFAIQKDSEEELCEKGQS